MEEDTIILLKRINKAMEAASWSNIKRLYIL